MPRGRILAVKWGMNPNSSSLGVDVTFLLFGATAIVMATPFVAALVRWRRPVATVAAATTVTTVAAAAEAPVSATTASRGVAGRDEGDGA